MQKISWFIYYASTTGLFDFNLVEHNDTSGRFVLLIYILEVEVKGRIYCRRELILLS